jgi:16S rRNA processing protein RimM
MTERDKDNPRLVLLGEITGAHGIRGAVFLKTYTSEPEGIAAYGPLDDEGERRKFKVTVQRMTSKGAIATIEGIADRNAAEALKGTKLYLHRDKLPSAEPGEYYHTDLIGLEAVDACGKRIGFVVSIANYGAGDLLDIAIEGSKKTELVPLTEVFVGDIDLESRRIVVTMPVFAPDGENPKKS